MGSLVPLDGDLNGCGANAVSCSVAMDETIALQGMYDAQCPTCPRGIVTTESWVNGKENYESVVDTDGNIYFDTATGVGLAGPNRGPLGAPSDGQWHMSSDPAWSLVSATYNSPGAALNDFLCSGNGYCSLGFGIGMVIIGGNLGEVVPDIEIPDWVSISFEDTEFSTVVLQADTTVFRAETYAFPGVTGSFFGTEMPTSVVEADELYNITTANPANQMNYVNSYTIPGGTTVVYGPVAGGTGMQMWVPSTSGITQVGTQVLH